jgi:hypothetical protein
MKIEPGSIMFREDGVCKVVSPSGNVETYTMSDAAIDAAAIQDTARQISGRIPGDDGEPIRGITGLHTDIAWIRACLERLERFCT